MSTALAINTGWLPEAARLYIELLKVLLSWPPVILCLAAVLLFTLRAELQGLVIRIIKLAVPGMQLELESQASRKTDTSVLAPAPDSGEAELAASTLPAQASSSPPVPADTRLEAARDPSSAVVSNTPQVESADTESQALKDAKARALSEQQRALLWEFRYIDSYLVPRTQLVLTGLAERPQTIAETDARLAAANIPAHERIAIVKALLEHYLAEVRDNDLLAVTNKGLDYLRYRGPFDEYMRKRLPPPPPPASGTT
jgi:hypothetical protein